MFLKVLHGNGQRKRFHILSQTFAFPPLTCRVIQWDFIHLKFFHSRRMILHHWRCKKVMIKSGCEPVTATVGAIVLIMGRVGV